MEHYGTEAIVAGKLLVAVYIRHVTEEREKAGEEERR